MKDCYLFYAQRTPMGRINGALSPVRVDDLLAHVFSHFKSKANFDLLEIDDVISGCANQAGEDNRNLSRMALLLAEFPVEVPGMTVNRLCGSSLDSVIDGWSRISLGLADCILVGGAESMTRAPLVVSKASSAFGRDSKMYDTTLGWRFINPKMEKLFPIMGLGQTAEEVGKLYNISREEQDEFALSSHQKAIKAQEEGKFNDELVPVHIKLRKREYTVEQDECPRKDTSLEKLSKLRPAFMEDGTVTAGNSSPMNDGAAAVAIGSEEFIKRHNIKPLLRLTGAGVRGVHPNTMGLGPIPAVKNLCEKFGKKPSDFDIVELNEAFAVQGLACMKELGWESNIVNKNGGAIALGHPLGCSGTRILTTLAHQMKNDPSLKQGVATMCIGVGQGVALSVENCQ